MDSKVAELFRTEVAACCTSYIDGFQTLLTASSSKLCKIIRFILTKKKSQTSISFFFKSLSFASSSQRRKLKRLSFFKCALSELFAIRNKWRKSKSTGNLRCQVKAVLEFVLFFFFPHHEFSLFNVFPFWKVKISNHRIVTAAIQNREQHSNWLSRLLLSLFYTTEVFVSFACTKQASKKRQSALTKSNDSLAQVALC